METQLIDQAKEFVKTGNEGELIKLIHSMKNSVLLDELSKAKVSKLLRQLLDALASIPNTLQQQQSLVKDLIQWTASEGRIYLKQYLEIRLVKIHFELKHYQDALNLSAELLRELRRLDDKMMLLEVYLLESRIQLALKNVPKAKAALTSARVFANAIYCPPPVQAALDMQSGILHAEESDFKTAFSYFYETFEGLLSVDEQLNTRQLALKYMLMCKIMMNEPEQVVPTFNTAKNKVVSSEKIENHSSTDISRDLEAVLSISKAYQHRSLKEFELALVNFKQEIEGDPLIQTHLNHLYDSLLEKNLVKIIEPYSRVELSHLASILSLPVNTIESKLSQMILDKIIYGMLDQATGYLVILDKPKIDDTYVSMLAIVKQLDHVVDALYQKASALN